MKIQVTLNGTKTILDSQADEPLQKVLHRNGFASVKSGCAAGFCGTCTVLINDKPVASCKIPVGLIKGTEIVTLEAFEKTPEYAVIMEGFKKAGIKLCGYCNSGKIFTAYQILKMHDMPTRQEISNQIKTLATCCTDLDTLTNCIIYAIKLYNTSGQSSRHLKLSSKL